MDQGTFLGLLHKRLSGELKPDETGKLQNWLQSTPENSQLAERVEQAWELSESYQPAFQPSVEKGLSRLKQRIQADREERPIRQLPQTGSNTRWLYRIAAAAVVLFGLFGAWQFIGNSASAGMQELATNNLKEDFQLEDGSTVVLNKHGQIQYPGGFEKDARDLQLKGEAFFEVAKDPSRPFTVNLDGASVRVLGTAFNIRALEGEDIIELTVEHGRVAFNTTDGGVSQELTAGQQLIYNRVKNTVRLSKDDQLNALAWKRNSLVFNNVALPEIVRYLEHYYEVDIEINSSSLQNCNFTVNYDNTPLDEALEILKASYQLEINENEQGQIILSGGNCK